MSESKSVFVIMWDGKPESVWSTYASATAHLELLIGRYLRQFKAIPVPVHSVNETPWEEASPWPYPTS
jgi:hypothetical protein